MSADPYDLLGDDDEPARALGLLLEEDRGSLPFALLHGEALVVCAAWAMGDARVRLVDVGTPWSEVVEAGAPVVLHDPLCPATPAAFIAECVERARATGRVVVGVRPVTDTVKQVSAGLVGETVDRDGLRAVCSPLVLPAAVAAAMGEPPGFDLAALVTRLAPDHEVELVEAPPRARRVHDLDDVRLLEQLTGSGAGSQE